MRHSHLSLAAGKTEADSGQRDDPDLGALQRCGMRRTQLLCVLPPAAHGGSAAQCAAGKNGFLDLEEAGEKAQPVIQRVISRCVDRLPTELASSGKMKYGLNDIRIFSSMARLCDVPYCFAVQGMKYITNEAERV